MYGRHPRGCEAKAAICGDQYRRQALSIWARVPIRQKGDDTNSGLSAFIPAALDEVGKHGITRLPKTIRAIWKESFAFLVL
jgi:hypothetical protein